MSRRVRYVVAGSLALAAVVACLVYGQRIQEAADRERTEVLERYGGEVVDIVVASETLEVGDVVDRQNVELEDWVSDLVPEGAVTSLEDVLGRTVTVPVAEGVPLTSLNFRDDEGSLEVPSGYVALSVSVSDKLGLPSQIRVGARLFAWEVGSDGVALLTGDLQVLRVPADTQTIGSSGSITLAVSPDDVAAILSASAEGSLRLGLPADDVSVEVAQTAPTEVAPEEQSDDAYAGALSEEATGGSTTDDISVAEPAAPESEPDAGEVVVDQQQVDESVKAPTEDVQVVSVVEGENS